MVSFGVHFSQWPLEVRASQRQKTVKWKSVLIEFPCWGEDRHGGDSHRLLFSPGPCLPAFGKASIWKGLKFTVTTSRNQPWPPPRSTRTTGASAGTQRPPRTAPWLEFWTSAHVKRVGVHFIPTVTHLDHLTSLFLLNCVSLFPCHLNRKTNLHLYAALPVRQSRPAPERSRTQSQWGTP